MGKKKRKLFEQLRKNMYDRRASSVLEYGNSLNIPTYSYEFLKDGFDKCVEVTKSGGIILLSPASASWDQYKECEIRGAEFKKKVEELKNEN